MENIFVYLYICIYNFMYTFLAAQLWERKKEIQQHGSGEKPKKDKRPTWETGLSKATKNQCDIRTVQNIAAVVSVWWTANWGGLLATAHDESGRAGLYVTKSVGDDGAWRTNTHRNAPTEGETSSEGGELATQTRLTRVLLECSKTWAHPEAAGALGRRRR